jgi:nicotinamidase-related amidase
MKSHPERLVLVIDAQKAFCDVDGSLAKVFGEQELEVITTRLVDIDLVLRNYPNLQNVFLIRSEYVPGQFTEGNLSHLYANACVPGIGSDCRWSLSDAAVEGKKVLTKTQESAATIPGFIDELRSMVSTGLSEILITGFLTTSCVRKTTLDIRKSLPMNVTIGVIEGLCGSRKSNYKTFHHDVFPRHDLALREMEKAGVLVIPGNTIPKQLSYGRK